MNSAMSLDAAVKSQIETLIQGHRVTVFMKGNKSFPQCGFSATVVGILKELGAEFHAVNVLADPALREGIKVFSDWPTIPQVYVDGQFIGGCDIVREMHASGELATALGLQAEPVKAPSIRISDAAAKAFRDAEEPGEDKLRLEIDPSFQIDLYFGPRKKGDLEISENGVTVLVDPASAKRADGISIDYVDGPDGAGFKIDNPNAPPSVKVIGARDLQTMLASASKPRLYDVRTEREREIASIPGGVALENEGRAELEMLDKATPIVFYCHHGVRSQAAAEHYLKQGFTRVYNLRGGIDAWASELDPKMPRY